MGRIKSAMIRRAARELVAAESGFSSDFENNKALLKNIFPYKSTRNKVAGCIVQLKRAEMKVAVPKEEVQEVQEFEQLA
mgnify:CR=1 FL=1